MGSITLSASVVMRCAPPSRKAPFRPEAGRPRRTAPEPFQTEESVSSVALTSLTLNRIWDSFVAAALSCDTLIEYLGGK